MNGAAGPRRRVTGAAAVVLLLLVAGCGGTAPRASSGPPEPRVQVDTPALQRAKKAAGIADCRPGTGAAAGTPLPAVTLSCLGGGPPVRLDRLRGPLVINLFAQWCGPCRQELPYYQRLHEKAAGKVKVLGIDYLDTQPGMALELAQQAGVTYPLLADPSGELRGAFRVRGLPGVVFVDAHGNVKAVEFEVMRSYGQLQRLVHERLGVAVPG